jgi:hypothetical protein
MALWGLGALEDRVAKGRGRAVMLRVAASVHAAAFVIASVAFPFKANIDAARFVGSRPDNTGVVYYDMQNVETGGSFWYRSWAPILPVRASALEEVLSAQHPPPRYLVSKAAKVPVVPEGWSCVEVARFSSVLPMKPRRRLVVYRIGTAE